MEYSHRHTVISRIDVSFLVAQGHIKTVTVHYKIRQFTSVLLPLAKQKPGIPQAIGFILTSTVGLCPSLSHSNT